MAKVGTAEFDVLLSRQKLAGEVRAAAREIEQGLGTSAQRVEREFSQTSKEIGDSLGDSAKRAEAQFAESAKRGAAAFAIYKGGQFLNGAVDAASNLSEAQSKVNVVFGESVGVVENFAKGAATAIGQSERQVLAAAGTYGNLFATMGIGTDKSAELSVSLVQLASDMSSFNDVPIDQALEAIRSGLVGETEPLRNLGVNLNEATLKTRAMTLGLLEKGDAMTAGARAQAAYSIIMEQSSRQQGDFQRNISETASQQKILAAETENASASLGDSLMPVYQAAITVLRGAVSLFDALPQQAKVATVAIGGAAAAFVLFGPQVASAAALVRGLGASGAQAATGLTAATAATSALGTASSVAAAGQVQLSSGLVLTSRGAAAMGVSAGGAAAGTTAMAGASRGLTAALGPLGAALAVAYGLYKGFSNAFDGKFGNFEFTGSTADMLGGTNEELVEFAGLIDAFDSSQFAEIGKQDITVLYAMRDALSEAGHSSDALNQAITDTEAATALATERTEKYADASAGATTAVEDEISAREKHIAELEKEATARAEAVDRASDAVQNERDIHDAQRNATSTAASLILAQHDLNVARAAAKGDSDEYRRALDGIAQAERGVADAAANTRRATEALSQARKDAAETLEDLRFAAERGEISEIRAGWQLEDARAEAALQAQNPEATARDRAEAALSIREAELALAQARDQRADSAEALAEAERKGIEGSDQVVAAKERVTAALDAQREAERSVADASAAAAAVLVKAKGDVERASKTLEDRIYDEAEAAAELAGLTGDASDATDAYVESLLRWGATLDPASPMRTHLGGFLTDLAALNRELDLAENRVPGATSAALGEVVAPTGLSTGQLFGGRSMTVNMTNGPSARDVADELMWGGN